jgi:hypothetical protein
MRDRIGGDLPTGKMGDPSDPKIGGDLPTGKMGDPSDPKNARAGARMLPVG